MAQIYLSTEKKIMDMENRLVVAEGEGVGGTGSLGLMKELMQTLSFRMDNEVLLYSRGTMSSHS